MVSFTSYHAAVAGLHGSKSTERGPMTFRLVGYRWKNKKAMFAIDAVARAVVPDGVTCSVLPTKTKWPWDVEKIVTVVGPNYAVQMFARTLGACIRDCG